MGNFPYEDIEALDLPEASRGIDGMEFHGKASFLKAGIVYADAVTTVSPTYAREIQGSELGFGLEGVLAARASSLFGVLNGIDTTTWNPQTDPRILERATTRADARSRKIANKRLLKRKLELEGPDDVPLLGCVTRITHQKGVDLIARAIPQARAHPGCRSSSWARAIAQMIARVTAAQLEAPRSSRPLLRLRRDPRAPGGGRSGRVPHALALRAVRHEPDVQPALRHAAHRARHRRAGGHHRGRRRHGERCHRLPHAQAHHGTRWSRRCRARWPRTATRRAGNACRCNGMQRTSGGTGAARDYARIYARTHTHFINPISKRCESAA